MSKLGKKPIAIPKDAKVKLESGKLILTGPKGSKELSLNDKIFSTKILENNNLILKLIKKNESSNVIWGTTRSKINSALIGVTAGHEKILEITGVGLRAILKEPILNFAKEDDRETQKNFSLIKEKKYSKFIRKIKDYELQSHKNFLKKDLKKNFY